ncbi:MAG: ComEC/Rec2 family competence protein, partial [Opitutales bacterium]|nr:ComEC/Rec2 family competence protein [Opitutales bacterium]
MAGEPFEPTGDLPKSARLSFYTPLLPYFLALMFACIIAGTFQWRVYSYIFLTLGTASVLLEITLRFFTSIFSDKEDSRKKYLFLCLRFVGIFFVCMWYFYFRIDANPYKNFAPREATITVKIDEVSRGANDSRYGVARIVSAPEFLKNSKGHKVWYTISDGKNRTSENKNITVSQLVKLTGIFASVYPDEVKARGHFSAKPESRAFEKYLNERFIYFKMNTRVANAEILESAEKRFEYFEQVRQYMEKSLTSFWRENIEEDEASKVYRAMILGDKSLLTKEQKRSYMDTGTMHVFAISGLHIGFATAVLFGILSALRLNWRIQPLLALPMLYLYVCACGARPSALRAFAFVAFVWCALSLSRGMKPFGALVLSAFIFLLISPSYIFDAGFVLSYAIVASIFVYSVPLYNYISYKIFQRIELDEISKTQRFLRWLIIYFLG